jgi:putative ABC transport system ATP-binding protein
MMETTIVADRGVASLARPAVTAAAAPLLEKVAPALHTAEPLVQLRNVTKTYRLGETTVNALSEVSLELRAGEFVAIWGPSGSGKTTLLNLIGLIDTPSSGQIFLGARELKDIDEPMAAQLRNHQIGFVFQNFNLIPVLSAVENVMLPLQMRGIAKRAARERALEMLAEVGLSDWAASLPDRMSGGQRQRVAIARALVTCPILVVADEPTANLDSENSQRVMQLMRELNRKHNALFVFSTHDPRILDFVERRIQLRDGRLVKETRP